MEGVLRRLRLWLQQALDALARVAPRRLLSRFTARGHAETRHADSEDVFLASEVDAESEFEMADPNPKDQPQDEQLSAAAGDPTSADAADAPEDDLDATLASMQSELEGLTDMIVGEDPPNVDTLAAPADELADDDMASEPDDVLAGTEESAGLVDDVEAFEEAVAAASDAEDSSQTPADELDNAASVAPHDDTDAAQVLADMTEAMASASHHADASAPDPVEDAEVDALLADVAVESEVAAGVPPVVERVDGAALDQDDSANWDVPGVGAAPATAAPSPAGCPGEMATDAVREAVEPFTVPRRKPRTARRPERTVESAIQGLAAFLQGEVNGTWNEARDALEEILTYRDEIRRTAQRISGLHRELQAMRDDVITARREARGIQTQMQNLRDDAARARQRTDAAALDAQSAADRAVAAAREAESAIHITREMS